ncbi:MAG TPA: SDR family NAD(P)-dependent oxidoreductase [Candidatus Acidoferrales bacterium]|nr:SDR family NAD(P)-dependent oxidoreductase [Candidatus Acidoferrales bacterium]
MHSKNPANIERGDGGRQEAPLREAVALVTGASRGIGLAIAGMLQELGAKVAICARDAAQLDAAAAQLSSAGGTVLTQAADVSRAVDVEHLVRSIEAHLGTISILVNNAGIGLFGAVQERTEEEWDRVLDTNLKSVFLVSRAVIPGMIRRGGGDIINISSLAGRNAFAGGALYCASKWGLQGLTACMAEDLREHGIRVASVLPGSVATSFSSRPKDPAKALLAEDVAHAVATLVTQRPQSFISEIQLRPLRK